MNFLSRDVWQRPNVHRAFFCSPGVFWRERRGPWVASKARGRSRWPRRGGGAGDNAAVALVTRIPRVISSRKFSRKLGIFSPFPHHSSTCRGAIFILHPSPTNDSRTLVSPPPPPPPRIPSRREEHCRAIL